MTPVTLAPLHPDAVALSIFRVIKGNGCQYGVAPFADGRAAVEVALRRAAEAGFLAPSETAANYCFAVLDVLDAEGDWIQDFALPSEEAFEWWNLLLGLEIESRDGTG
jgi:hypothetical protein